MSPTTGMSHFSKVLLSAILSAAFAACTSMPATSNEAVERLFEARRNFEGASSLADVRVTGKGGQSFRAALVIDASGGMTLSALTPFGTSAAQVRIENDSITLVNHLKNIYWQGNLDQLSGGHALADAFRVEGLSFLLTGLPPWTDEDRVRQEPVSEDLTRLSSGPLSLVVSRGGIASGRLDLGSDEVVIRFGGQSIPPAKLEVSSSLDPTKIVQFEHLDLDFKPVTLQPLNIPERYRRAEHWEMVVQ